MRPAIAFLLLCMLTLSSFAREQPAAPALPDEANQTAGHETQADPEPHPALSEDASWARDLATFIIALFVLAAAVGSLARLSLPEEPPQAGDAHGHDTHDAHAGGAHDAHAPAHAGHH
jgi:hypothetical protein